jgi:murein DD-endopeptidase MepM/ murein hydrolase activator NlpD
MPGAPRAYRGGVHEGVDFYESDSCTVIGWRTEVLAAQAGTVVRADWAYQDLTGDTLAELFERVERGESEDPAVKDAFRGRQVWIEHGDGVVTRYAHLSGIADGISIGAGVEQGAIIGYVGESGTPESLTAPATQVHLHFEIRTGDYYLGQGLSAGEVRQLYWQAFSP